MNLASTLDWCHVKKIRSEYRKVNLKVLESKCRRKYVTYRHLVCAWQKISAPQGQKKISSKIPKTIKFRDLFKKMDRQKRM